MRASCQSHFWAGLRYVEANPCRAGLARERADYPWSSAAAHLLGKADRSHVLDLEFWEQAGGAATWAEIHAGEGQQEQLIALRKCTYAGRPFGDEAFVLAMEGRFQRKWRRSAADLVGEVAISA